MKISNKGIANVFITISLIILGIIILRISLDGYTFWNKLPIDFTVTGQIGDFIGGVIGTLLSAAGLYFLYLTLNEQRRSFERERLESKFFELIKLHRDNVSELKFDGKQLIENEDSLFIEKIEYEGKAVFKVIFNQFIICKNELTPFFKKAKMFLPEYEKLLLEEPFVVNNKIDIAMLAKIDICYSIIFYGLSAEGLLILSNLFRKKYKDKFVDDILRYLSLKPARELEIQNKWEVLSHRNTRGKRNVIVEQIYDWRKTKKIADDAEFKEIVIDYHNRFIKYYGGHQFRIGHYFRHFFQTVKYINNQNDINYDTKYEYVKILRAQLSTYEQAILFINSLSEMGKSWEIYPEINKTLKKCSRHDFELITKYNLIKNIPGDSFYGIHFKEFFPKIEYESDSLSKKRPPYK